MTEDKRFDLKSVHFKKLTIKIYDKFEDKELDLSLFEIVDLLNEVAEPEYTLKDFRDDVCDKIDEIMELHLWSNDKRFRKVLGLIQDNNGDLLDLTEIEDKMNQLNNENEQLKKRNKVLSDQITAQGIVIEGYQERNMRLYREKEELINGVTERPFTNEIHRIIRDDTEIACGDTMGDAEIIVDLLNRQRSVIMIERRTRERMVDALKKEIRDSDGVLRESLVRILKKKI